MTKKFIGGIIPVIVWGAVELVKAIVDLVKTADKVEAKEPPARPEPPITEKKKEEDHDESY